MFIVYDQGFFCSIKYSFWSFLVPAVTIVMNGGDATISNIYHDLRENISVVIIEVSAFGYVMGGEISLRRVRVVSPISLVDG